MSAFTESNTDVESESQRTWTSLPCDSKYWITHSLWTRYRILPLKALFLTCRFMLTDLWLFLFISCVRLSLFHLLRSQERRKMLVVSLRIVYGFRSELNVKKYLWLLLVFSVTAFKIDQNKNQNSSIDRVQNLGNERRYIYKDPLRDIRRNVLPKLTEICMETPCWCSPGWAPTWRLETNRNICYRVLQQKREFILRETHKHESGTFSNTWTV